MAGLRAGQNVDAVFACSRKDRLTARSGSPYLALELRDRTGAIQARAFKDADLLAGRFERGDLVRVAGRVDRFRDELQIEVRNYRPRRAGRPGGVPAGRLPQRGGARGLPRAPRPRGPRSGLPDAAGAPARRRGAASRSGGAPPARAAGTTPTSAGCSSTRSRSARSRSNCAQLHPRLNPDLLLTAALVHDLGKTRKFTYGAEIGLTDEGRLLGHIVLGQQILGHATTCPRTGGSRSPTACSPTTARKRRPGAASALPEALALYRLNALDAGRQGRARDRGLAVTRN